MSVSTMEPQRCIPRPPSPLYGGPASPQALGAGGNGKDFTERTLRSLKVSLGKLWRRRSVTITEYDPVYKCAYLGNVLTGWAKGEGCVEKPLSTLWKNYTSSSKPDVQMKVTVTQSGLKAVTKEHGLTEYWSHRVTYCAAPSAFPRIFCWVYRHEGRKLKQELRCHAVLCSKEAVAKRMATQLRSKLAQALLEFKRDKVCRQNARLSLANSVYDNPSLPRRKILLSTGSHNYRPPLERSKSAPKLMAIEESLEEDDEQDYKSTHSRFLQRINSVPLAREEIKHLSPEHISRIFQRVNVISGEKSAAAVPEVVLHEEIEGNQDDRRYEEVFVGKHESSSPTNGTSEHVFDVQAVPEDGLTVPEVSERRYSKSPLVRRNSIKRVGWAIEPDRRRYSNSYNNERLLVLGKEEDEDDEEEEEEECRKVLLTDELGESDENSLQSISSSGSGSSDTSSSARRNQENTQRQYPYMYQETQQIMGGQQQQQQQHSNNIIYQELQRGIQESRRGVYDDGGKEVHHDDSDFDDVVEFRPMGGGVTTDDMLLELDALKNTFRRSATFPPPSQDAEELLLLDSLSDEDVGKEDEETESDESGYVESTEKDYLKPEDKDTPQRQIIKSILRPTNRNSQCVQV